MDTFVFGICQNHGSYKQGGVYNKGLYYWIAYHNELRQTQINGITSSSYCILMFMYQNRIPQTTTYSTIWLASFVCVTGQVYNRKPSVFLVTPSFSQ